MPEAIQALLRKLKKGLVNIYGDRLKAVYLYGSYARGEAQPGSDVDVMIALDDYQSYGKEIDRIGELASRLSLEYGLSISRVMHERNTMATRRHAAASKHPRRGDHCMKEYTIQLLDKAAEAIEAAE